MGKCSYKLLVFRDRPSKSFENVVKRFLKHILQSEHRIKSAPLFFFFDKMNISGCMKQDTHYLQCILFATQDCISRAGMDKKKVTSLLF